MNNCKGSIVIRVLDEKTMKVKSEMKADNVINLASFYSDMIIPDTASRWNGHSNSYPQPSAVGLSGRVIKPNNKTLCYYGTGYNDYPAGSGYPSSNYILKREDATLSGWVYNSGNPPFIQRIARFESPDSTRTINSVYLLGRASNNLPSSRFVASSIALTTPCIQNPGEVLDVTYRIQFFEEPISAPNGIFISPDYFRESYVATRLYATQSSSFPSYTVASYFLVPENSPDNEIKKLLVGTGPGEGVIDQEYRLYENTTSSNYEGVFSYEHFKTIFTNSLEKESKFGKIIRSTTLSCEPHSSFFDAIGDLSPLPDVYPSATIATPFVPDNFAFQPIQPIQNHSKTAVKWGLDVNHLSTSQGSITVNGDNWTNPDWPEFWRVEFSKTGAVGTSNYFFRNRRILGFFDDTYRATYVRRTADHLSSLYPDRKTVENDHGVHEIEKNEEYGADSYISWDDNGINIHIVNKPKVLAYDSTTSPALNVTGISQVAVTENGDIWIACRNTGLHKITSPLDKSSATVVTMSEASNSLFAGSESNCYAVAIGHSDSVWAVFEGALSHTTNPSDATPVFANYNSSSSTPFDYTTELTGTPWSATKYIKVDRNTDTNELAVMYNIDDRERIMWWSTDGVSYIGPLSQSFFNNSYDWINGKQINSVDVSRKGNMWAQIGPDFVDVVRILAWGTDMRISVTHEQAAGFSRPAFVYDYYNTPIFANNSKGRTYKSTSTSDRGGITLTSVDRHAYGYPELFASTNAHYPSGISWQNDRSNGMLIACASSYETSRYKSGSAPTSFLQLSPHTDSYLDPLNGQYSPYEEVYWDRYHWNGTDWELNYHVDAIDTSSGTTYPAKRHNFDTESHEFTGRSLLDVSGAFATNNFTNPSDATFVFSVRPAQKDDGVGSWTWQIHRASKGQANVALFDFSTNTKRCRLDIRNIDDSATSPKMSFYEDDTRIDIGSELPVLTNGFHRVVVSISGTSVNIYVDSVQIGSTITLNTAFDFSNANNDLIAHIAARVYKWEHPQRHSPWLEEFFKGEMENIQLWNVAWDATDVANDYNDITGVITSKPATNLIARYELLESLEGTETKPTHTTPEIMDEGITIAFADGQSPESFVATDYYTFGVVDGILKDNSMSMSRSVSLYHKPTDHDFSDFKNENNTSVIEGTTATQVTEVVKFKSTDPLGTFDTSGFNGTGNNLRSIDVYPGKLSNSSSAIGTISSFTFDDSSARGGYTKQPIVNDGYFEAAPATADTFALFGLHTNPDQTFNGNNNYQGSLRYKMLIMPSGDISIVEGSSIVASNVGTYTIDSTFRIRKVGSTVTYHVETGGAETLLYTSTIAATQTLYGVVVFNPTGFGIVDAVINYTRISNMLTIGDPTTNTGSFDPKFLRVDSEDAQSYEIFIDGTPAEVVAPLDEVYLNLPVPDPGQVVLDGKTGWLIFNDLDVGKTVTGRVTVIYDEN